MKTRLLPAPVTPAEQTAAAGLPPGQTLRSSVSAALSAYLTGVDEDYIRNFYDTVMAEVEPPLLAAVMHKARSNQSRAAVMLGLNRGTLRKKLKQYNMLD